ncbi:MAG: FHA domain-containing protein [Solirubrobacteraceae bacterium]
MESLTSGTLAGTGSFRCEACGYVLTLAAADALPPCPGCKGEQFARASLFGTRFRREDGGADEVEGRRRLLQAASEIAEAGDYLIFEEGAEVRVVALQRDWTRIGRSLAADVRLDDPTISRRHALVVRGPDGVRVLDDRSLNGVFVNGSRVEWQTISDGDEIVVGRYRVHFVSLSEQDVATADTEFEAAG